VVRSSRAAVERDVEDAYDLARIASLDLGDPGDHLDHVGQVRVRAHDARLLGALEQRLTGGVHRASRAGEHRRVALHAVEQLGGERLLGGRVADEPAQPRDQRIPRLKLGERSGRPAQQLDLLGIHGLE
jgi:hypothetical protein